MIGLKYKIHIPDYTENNSDAYSPADIVTLHARHKSQAVAPHYPKAWIIGADTIVVRDNQILGKPRDEKDAVRMLQFLSGAQHSVFTGYCILNSANGRYIENVVETRVTFKNIHPDDIEHYVRFYHPYDKAGAYAIQDFSAVFVEKIDGCFYNVVGFPLPAFYEQVRTELFSCL
jgi:septum formation protein